MRIGMMKNKIQIQLVQQEQNGVGESVEILNNYLTIKAAVMFEKTTESGSKFTDKWSNQLIVTARYSDKLMSVIQSRAEYKIIWQNKIYNIKNYEIWNHEQKYVKFYIQEDNKQWQ